MQLSVRNVNKKVFQDFKAQAVKEGMDIGEALNIALEMWVERKKMKKKSFMELKPVDWGKGTEKASRDVDEYLYSR